MFGVLFCCCRVLTFFVHKHIICKKKCNFFCNVTLFSIPVRNALQFMTDYKGTMYKDTDLASLRELLLFHNNFTLSF